MGSCRYALKRLNMDLSKGKGYFYALLVNVLGSVAAGSSNCLFMRIKELDGVKVLDKKDNNTYEEVGYSKKGGISVLQSMVISRGMLSLFATGIPVILLMGLNMFKFYHRRKYFYDTICVTIGLAAGLPLSVSIFEPYLKFSCDDLEEEFRKYRRDLYVYKGLWRLSI